MNTGRASRYPGVRGTADGSEAVVWVESRLAEFACAAPRFASSRIAALFRSEAANGRTNLWEQRLRYLEFDSAGSAGSACEGYALAGGRVANFSNGQGLLEMAEVLVSAAGRRLPIVLHVASQSLASQGLSVHAGHDDLMLLADAGCAMLVARDVQDVADLSVVARRAAELAETPVIVVQDGYLTTHTVQSVRLPEPELLKTFIGAPAKRVRAVFNPKQPLVSGPVQNQDSYMKGRIAQRYFAERVRPAIATTMSDYAELTGRACDSVQRYRMDDAEFGVVCLGSLSGAAESAIDALRVKGVKAGLVSVICLRPFPRKELLQAVARCRSIAVVERTDAPMAESNPLATEIKAMLAGAQTGDDARLLRVPEVYSGAAGLGGSPVHAGHIVAAIENMQRHGRRVFALGVKHADALEPQPCPDPLPAGSFAVRCVSFGEFGTFPAVKTAAAAIADAFAVEVQASSRSGAEQRCSSVRCELVVSRAAIPANYEPEQIDVLAIDSADAFREPGLLDVVRPGGAVHVRASGSPFDIWSSLPASARRAIRERELRVYVQKPEREPRLQGAALAGAILKLMPRPAAQRDVRIFDAIGHACQRFYAGAEAGEAAAAMKAAYKTTAAIAIPDIDPEPEPVRPKSLPIACGDGELIPTGFCDHVVGMYSSGRASALEADLFAARSLVPPGVARYRSYRNFATNIARFASGTCTGCMECVNLCPDSAIRARVAEPESVDHAPAAIREQFTYTQKYYETPLKRGEAGGLFGLYIDADRCKGCGECVEVCAAKALSVVPKTAVELGDYDRIRDFFEVLPDTPAKFLNPKSPGDILLSQRAWLHTGGASSCPGCGPSSAIRMMLAGTGFFYGTEQIGVVAALGCHQAAGATYPYSPYEVAWTNTQAANAPAEAMGIRARWDEQGFAQRRLWVVGGDDAIVGAGLHSLAAMVRSGLDIKVLILDKGQRAPGQGIGLLPIAFPNALVAQTTPAHVNHFYRSILTANDYVGPAIVIAYTACIDGHDLPEASAYGQAKLAVESRTFPLFIYDPKNGDTMRGRLDLRGNPSIRTDWAKDEASGHEITFAAYAHTEPRFANLSGLAMETAERSCLLAWRQFQEFAGLR